MVIQRKGIGILQFENLTLPSLEPFLTGLIPHWMYGYVVIVRLRKTDSFLSGLVVRMKRLC